MSEEKTGNGTQKPEMSLDALAASLQATKETPTEQPGKQEAEFKLPDLSEKPDEFKAALEESTKGIAEKLEKVTSFIDKQEQQAAESKMRGDLDAAVEFVSGQIEDVDKRLVRAILKDEADENAAFRQIWDARDSHPEALQQALTLLGEQYKDTFAPRVDQEVASTQRAFQESIKAARTGREDEIAQTNNSWDSKSDDQFDSDFAQLAGNAM